MGKPGRRKRPSRPPRRLAGGFYSIERRVLTEDMRGDAALYLVWTTLIGWANVSDGKEKLSGQQVALRRGQVATSLDELADEWDLIGTKQVRRCLDYLEKTGRIGTQKGTHGTIITIHKFDHYQKRRIQSADDRAAKGHALGTPRARQGQHKNKGTREQGNHIFPLNGASAVGEKRGRPLSVSAAATLAVSRAVGCLRRQHELGSMSDDEREVDAEAELGDTLDLILRKYSSWRQFVRAYESQSRNGYGPHFESETAKALRAFIQADRHEEKEKATVPQPSPLSIEHPTV